MLEINLQKIRKLKKNEDILLNLDNILSNNISRYYNNSLSILYMIYYFYLENVHKDIFHNKHHSKKLQNRNHEKSMLRHT